MPRRPLFIAPVDWPSNWEDLIWQLGRFFSCGPEQFWRLTGRQLAEGVNQANAMIAAERKARSNVR